MFGHEKAVFAGFSAIQPQLAFARRNCKAQAVALTIPRKTAIHDRET
jgi:hypothetical protein